MSHRTDLAPIFVPKFLSKGVGVPPCEQERSNEHLSGDPAADFIDEVRWADLLHVSKNVLTAVEDAFALL